MLIEGIEIYCVRLPLAFVWKTSYGDLHRTDTILEAHGGFTPTVGELTPNGYRLELACCCGVTFERWVTAQDAVDDLLRERIRAERN